MIQAARHSNVFPCFDSAAKTSSLTGGIGSIMTSYTKLAVVKRSFSSSSSNKSEVPLEAKLSSQGADPTAKIAA